LRVFVHDNNVEQALRALKKKMQREAVFREMKRRAFYEKPSEAKSPAKGRSNSSSTQAGSQTGTAVKDCYPGQSRANCRSVAARRKLSLGLLHHHSTGSATLCSGRSFIDKPERSPSMPTPVVTKSAPRLPPATQFQARAVAVQILGRSFLRGQQPSADGDLLSARPYRPAPKSRRRLIVLRMLVARSC
jgi:ribosomal protein S21